MCSVTKLNHESSFFSIGCNFDSVLSNRFIINIWIQSWKYKAFSDKLVHFVVYHFRFSYINEKAFLVMKWWKLNLLNDIFTGHVKLKRLVIHVLTCFYHWNDNFKHNIFCRIYNVFCNHITVYCSTPFNVRSWLRLSCEVRKYGLIILMAICNFELK